MTEQDLGVTQTNGILRFGKRGYCSEVPWRDPRDKRSQERKNTQLDTRRTENLRNRY